ncbi:MAG: dinitrogenase iron-molybdenum cofactor biosynthesis protein [Lachnospiraceae bacterium]|nr:dinitrogenase iron-molybdenum cofactor biosynthesis protein [Lachnospiraceae bacterium]
MKVAVTYENGEVFQHFGRTPAFKVYEVSDGKVLSSEVIDTNGTGHGALAGFLADIGAEVMICGGIGGGAIAAMSEAGIKVYAGASGSADDAVNAYVAGTLPEIGDATCDHHEHEGHGEHGCGHGGCHQ